MAIMWFYLVFILLIVLTVSFGVSLEFPNNKTSKAVFRAIATANDTQAENAIILQKQRKKLYKQNYVPYSEAENVVRKSSMPWETFVASDSLIPRSKPYIRSSMMKSLQQCIAPNAAPTCRESLSDNYLTTWRSRKVNGLCEENASSKISCYDSVNKVRFCVFENAMMDFHKVRRRKVDGHSVRSWERGFLAADCGDMAPDDIGYIPLYKPDIERREDAVCDFIFSEPVLAYSHENIRNFGAVTNDYFNVLNMLALAGASHVSKDVSFFNFDGLRKGKYFNDQTNQFFKMYNVTFRRILKAVDFTESKAKLCFKKLIMPPRSIVQFHADSVGGTALTSTAAVKCAARTQAEVGAGEQDPAVAMHRYVADISSLFQRWNLQLRQNYELLRLDAMPTQETLQLLVITRTPPPHGPNTTHVLSRMYANTGQIVSALTAFVGQQRDQHPNTPIKLVVQDFLLISFSDQVRLIASSGIVVGMHGAGIASTMHMAVGTKYCCGVVEIFPEGEFKSIRGYGNMARRMGHHYERLSVAPQHTSLQGTEVPVEGLLAAVRSVTERIAGTGGSCFLPEVITTPYL